MLSAAVFKYLGMVTGRSALSLSLRRVAAPDRDFGYESSCYVYPVLVTLGMLVSRAIVLQEKGLIRIPFRMHLGCKFVSSEKILQRFGCILLQFSILKEPVLIIIRYISNLQ